jgi:tagatose 1,6-diphosphate aldolase
MTQTLTPGRYRGLKMTANDGHIFNILAFDQRGSYRKMLPAATSFEDAVAIKREVVVGLAPHVTAVLLDNQYGLPSVLGMRGGCGVLMSLEESGYSGDATYRRLQFNPDWTAAKIRRMGASAVKLLAYYHPHSGALADEIEQVVRQVVAECHAQDLPVFLEPMSYSLDANIAKESAEFARTRPEVVIETARRLTHTGADVLKLEFPVDAAFNNDVALWQRTCEQVSAAATVPWVLLSAGVDFETFATQTDIACRAGASGWLAGRAIWKECVTYSPAERQAFLAGTAVTRTQRLNVLAHQARPWTDFYSPPATGGDWYTTY